MFKSSTDFKFFYWLIQKPICNKIMKKRFSHTLKVSYRYIILWKIKQARSKKMDCVDKYKRAQSRRNVERVAA